MLCSLKIQALVHRFLACTGKGFSSFGATKDSFTHWLSLGQYVALIMSLFTKETGKDKYIVFNGGETENAALQVSCQKMVN